MKSQHEIKELNLVEHSLCSPSAMKRRDLCPGSLAEEAPLESVDTKFSADGTGYHHEMDDYLNSDMTGSLSLPARVSLEMLQEAIGDTLLPGGMTACGGKYVTEMRFDIISASHIYYKDFANVDLVIIYESELRAVVVDWKFGGMLVDHPAFNHQLKDYCVAVWDELGHDYCIETTYIQPKARGLYAVQPWHFSPEDLITIALQLKAIRDRAYANLGEYFVGRPCAMCKAATQGTCQARQNMLGRFSVSQVEYDQSMNSKQMGNLLEASLACIKQAEIIKDKIKSYMLAGNKVDNYILAGTNNRLTRQVTGPDIKVEA